MMNKKAVVSFFSGAVAVYLVVVLARIQLYSMHIGHYNTHPTTGLVLTPIVAGCAYALGLLGIVLVQKFVTLKPTLLGVFCYGAWCALPVGQFLPEPVRPNWVLLMAVTLPPVLFLLRGKRRC